MYPPPLIVFKQRRDTGVKKKKQGFFCLKGVKKKTRIFLFKKVFVSLKKTRIFLFKTVFVSLKKTRIFLFKKVFVSLKKTRIFLFKKVFVSLKKTRIFCFKKVLKKLVFKTEKKKYQKVSAFLFKNKFLNRKRKDTKRFLLFFLKTCFKTEKAEIFLFKKKAGFNKQGKRETRNGKQGFLKKQQRFFKSFYLLLSSFL